MVTDDEVVKKYINTQKNAETRGIEFSLSLSKIRKLLNTKTCFYSGVILVKEPNLDNSLTFDRVDNNIGYTDSNTVACSRRINSVKGNVTLQELYFILKGVQKWNRQRK